MITLYVPTFAIYRFRYTIICNKIPTNQIEFSLKYAKCIQKKPPPQPRVKLTLCSVFLFEYLKNAQKTTTKQTKIKQDKQPHITVVE